MNKTYVLHHSYEVDGYDETKLIGIYSTKELAEAAIVRLKDKPGFRERPNHFQISEYEIDKDNWTEGYSALTTIQVKNKSNEWTTVQAECLPNNRYQIIELYENDSLGEFKHLDIVECEKRNDDLFAVKLIHKHNSADT